MDDMRRCGGGGSRYGKKGVPQNNTANNFYNFKTQQARKIGFYNSRRAFDVVPDPAFYDPPDLIWHSRKGSESEEPHGVQRIGTAAQRVAALVVLCLPCVFAFVMCDS